jgi:hypothetical protein
MVNLLLNLVLNYRFLDKLLTTTTITTSMASAAHIHDPPPTLCILEADRTHSDYTFLDSKWISALE